MSGTDDDLARQVSALADTLEELRRELEPGDRRRLRPPTPGELLRFTSEVTIPAAIVVLETNVRVLRLLQRTIRLADGREGRSGTGLRDRASALGRETMDQLDRTLRELQSATAGEPGDEEVRRLLERARDLRADVDARLAEAGTEASLSDPLAGSREPVDIDVETELDAIRREVEDGDNPDEA